MDGKFAQTSNVLYTSVTVFPQVVKPVLHYSHGSKKVHTSHDLESSLEVESMVCAKKTSHFLSFQRNGPLHSIFVHDLFAFHLMSINSTCVFFIRFESILEFTIL